MFLNRITTHVCYVLCEGCGSRYEQEFSAKPIGRTCCGACGSKKTLTRLVRLRCPRTTTVRVPGLESCAT